MYSFDQHFFQNLPKSGLIKLTADEGTQTVYFTREVLCEFSEATVTK